MSNSGKPIIVVSKCLGFEPCRYNGGMEPNSFIEILVIMLISSKYVLNKVVDSLRLEIP